MADLIRQEARSLRRLSVARMCRVLSVSRPAYYRGPAAARRDERAQEVRDQLQRLALEWPAYGYRRLTHALRRHGLRINPKRVLRPMRADNLLCLRRRRFIRTTDSQHGLAVYPNLVPELAVTGPDQLWVADLTYIRVRREFGYLAVILDAWSRRCIGWALGRSLEAELALAALRMALAARAIRPGLVHHSDRGVQYASRAYTALLTTQGIRISMSRRGNPYDNAQAESFLKTLKYEEVYLWEYATLAEARAHIGHFLEEVYNRKRLHSALGYRPPVEVEQSLARATSA
jgi:putative transposase